MKLFDKLRPTLERPAALWVAVGLGVLLTLPALGVGLVMDDHSHRAMMADDAPAHLARGPTELFSFMRDSDEWRATARDAGWIPWYADPEIHAEWWRPITSLTLYLDHLLWPDAPVLAHAHSLIWYAVLLYLVGLLFRRLQPAPWIAALAVLLYALDDAHGQPVGWLANRNALIAMTFGVAALLAHIKWRQEDWKPGMVVAPLALLLGLLSGEMALSITAYLFAYALFLEQGSLAQRLLTLVPCAVTAVGWRIAYSALGYGGQGSGLYLDPMSDPGRYAVATFERFPLLIQGQLTPLASDIYAFFPPPARLGLAAFATLGAAVTALILWRWLRSDRLAAFWVVGMLIATLPICAAFASDRLLFPTGIGAMGMLALLFARHADPAIEGFWERKLVRLLIVLFFLTHVVLAPLFKPLRTYQPKMMAASYTQAFHSLERLDTSLTGQTLVVVRAPDQFWSGLAITTREQPVRLVPERVVTLATGLDATRVTRESATTLRIAAADGFVETFLDRIFHNPQRPFVPGWKVALPDLTIEVTAVTDDGRPKELLCVFAAPLEASHRVWAAWGTNGYEPFVLPAVGETVELEALDVAKMASFRYELKVP